MLRRNKGFCMIVWSQYLWFDGMINNHLSVFVRSPVIDSIFFCAGLYRGYRLANRRTSSPPPLLPRARIIKSSCISSDLRRSGIYELKEASKEEEKEKKDINDTDAFLKDRSYCCVRSLFIHTPFNL